MSPLGLFFTFTRITLSSFGGAIFWARRMLVEQLRWLTEHEFVEVLALAQLLPGATGVNLAVMLGYRFGGWSGAAASLTGFLAAPCVVIGVLGALHHRYGGVAHRAAGARRHVDRRGGAADRHCGSHGDGAAAAMAAVGAVAGVVGLV